jgi:hypothetical protein
LEGEKAYSYEKLKLNPRASYHRYWHALGSLKVEACGGGRNVQAGRGVGKQAGAKTEEKPLQSLILGMSD